MFTFLFHKVRRAKSTAPVIKLIGLVLLLYPVPLQARFILNGVPENAPGTFSWINNNLTGWGGIDITLTNGYNAVSTFFDGVESHGDGNGAPIGIFAGGSPVQNSITGIYDLGQVFEVSTIELFQGPNNGWWGNLRIEIRISDSSSNWSSATSIGILIESGLWTYPPGSSAYIELQVNRDVRYVLVRATYYESNLLIDEMNINATGQLPPPPPPQDCREVWWQGFGITGDINHDCSIDLLDFAILANQFLQCNDPDNSACEQIWP
jgi:hypothetical protein